MSHAHFFGNPWKMDTPTKMALVQFLNDLKLKNQWHYRVTHEQIYHLSLFGRQAYSRTRPLKELKDF
jgi:ABC-type enterochelin transport system ATPase subunit